MNKVKLSSLIADPSQPRQEFDVDEMERLIKSINEKGILLPLIVEETDKKDKYLICDGERRFKAATELGLKEVPVVIEKAMSPTERMIMRFHLQDQHSDWSVFDRARAILFFKETQGITNNQTSELLGISPRTVQLWTSILRLSKRSQEYIIKKRIPFSYAEKIRGFTIYYQKICDLDPEEIEMKLINKYESKIFGNVNDFWKLKQVTKERGSKVIMLKFLNNPQMTIANVLKGTKIGTSVELETLAYRARSLKNFCLNLIETSEQIKVDTFQKKSIEELIDSLKQLL